jgi:hypothetical protein
MVLSEESRSLRNHEQAIFTNDGKFFGSYSVGIDTVNGNATARGCFKLDGIETYTSPLNHIMLNPNNKNIVVYGNPVFACMYIYLYMEVWTIGGECIMEKTLFGYSQATESVKYLTNGGYLLFTKEIAGHYSSILELDSTGKVVWKTELTHDISSWKWSYNDSTVFIEPYHGVGSIRGMYENHLPKPLLGTISNKHEEILVEELSEYKFTGPFDFISNELIAQVRYNKWYIIQANPSSKIISEGVLSFVPSKSSTVIAWNDESQFAACSREDASLIRIELVNVGDKKSEYSVSVPFIDDGDPFKVHRVKPNLYRVYSKNKSVVVEVQEIACRHE